MPAFFAVFCFFHCFLLFSLCKQKRGQRCWEEGGKGMERGLQVATKGWKELQRKSKGTAKGIVQALWKKGKSSWKQCEKVVKELWKQCWKIVKALFKDCERIEKQGKGNAKGLGRDCKGSVKKLQKGCKETIKLL